MAYMLFEAAGRPSRQGQLHKKRCSAALLGLGPDHAPVYLNDLPDKGKA